MVKNIDDYPNRVAEMFAGKTIFITGGTGFMGKVLVEKLLRTCPDLKKIYILVRFKRNCKPRGRLIEMFKNPLFDLVKSIHGEHVTDKVEPVTGDVTEIELGLIEGNQEKIITEVEIIYNCAATIRFDEPLKKAVLTNVRGTREVLKLAKKCQKLLAFCHVSTAYCHLREKVLEEKSYPPPANPHNVINTCEWLGDEAIEKITPLLLQDYPNTYAFTKALGEALVVEEMDNLPILIARPTVVVPIYFEPLPGWTDNINGPTGLLIGAGKGVIRSIYCKDDNYADFLPVDAAANGFLCIVYAYLSNCDKRIFNFASSNEHRVTWKTILDIGRKVVETEMPLNGCLWYPGGSMKNSRRLHLICFYLFQWIPAIFIDALLIVLGYKPILMRVQRRIYHGYEVFEYYTDKVWKFKTGNGTEVKKMLNPKEMDIYKIECHNPDYYNYFKQSTHAARLYLLKEGDDTLPGARRHMKIMWCVDKLAKFLLVVGIFYYLWKKVFSHIIQI